MSEVNILVPEQCIQIPAELEGMFDVVKHALDPNTPIRKTTLYTETPYYTQQPLTHPSDSPLMFRMGNPQFEVPSYWAPDAEPTGATSDLRGGMYDEYAIIAFAENHAVGKAAGHIYTADTGNHIWQLSIQTSSTDEEGRTNRTVIVADSANAPIGKTVSWKARNSRQTEFLFKTDRFEEIASKAARILIPTA